jgi:hypothetical protein
MQVNKFVNRARDDFHIKTFISRLAPNLNKKARVCVGASNPGKLCSKEPKPQHVNGSIQRAGLLLFLCYEIHVRKVVVDIHCTRLKLIAFRGNRQNVSFSGRHFIKAIVAER